MKKAKVFFHPIDGSGPLTLSWSSTPKGDAVEAKKGNGVGFFSEKGDLLCVIFDEVQSLQDRQVLEFKNDRVEIRVKNGRVIHTISSIKPSPLKQRPMRQIRSRARTRTTRTKKLVTR
jgi:hypothetical protein